MLSEEILTSHLCSTNEIRGESIRYTCKMEGWADRRVSMVGGGGRGGLVHPRNWKKDAVRGNFNLFHPCFTNEIRGDRQTLHTCKKWKGVGGQALVHGGRGWGSLAPPLENEKKRGYQRKF